MSSHSCEVGFAVMTIGFWLLGHVAAVEDVSLRAHLPHHLLHGFVGVKVYVSCCRHASFRVSGSRYLSRVASPLKFCSSLRTWLGASSLLYGFVAAVRSLVGCSQGKYVCCCLITSRHK